MPEDEKVEVMTPEGEDKVDITETAKPNDDVDNDIMDIVEKIQDTVSELANMVAELAQMQASDTDITEEIQESLKGMVHEELEKGLTAMKDEIIKELTKVIELKIPEPEKYLQVGDAKAAEGPDKEEVKVTSEELEELVPGKSGNMEKGETKDEVEKRLEIVEKIMKGEVSNIYEAKRMLRGV